MEISLEIDSVQMSFGNNVILSDVYLKCIPGDIIAIFGRNGSGKSTLFNIIFGTLKAEQSFIRINEQVIKHSAFKTGLVSFLPQYHFLPSHLKVSTLLNLYPDLPVSILNDTFLPDKGAKIKDLSGGELRYMEIILTLYNSATFVILDEPFNGLSPIAAENIRKHITKNALQKSIILTDHNYREINKVANRRMMLDNGYLKEIHEISELKKYGYLIHS